MMMMVKKVDCGKNDDGDNVVDNENNVDNNVDEDVGKGKVQKKNIKKTNKC